MCVFKQATPKSVVQFSSLVPFDVISSCFCGFVRVIQKATKFLVQSHQEYIVFSATGLSNRSFFGDVDEKGYFSLHKQHTHQLQAEIIAVLNFESE